MQTKATTHKQDSSTGATRQEPLRLLVIKNAFLRATVEFTPLVILLALLADWQIGYRVFAGDLFRLTGMLTTALEILLLNQLFKNLPETLAATMAGVQVSEPKFVKFTRSLEKWRFSPD